MASKQMTGLMQNAVADMMKLNFDQMPSAAVTFFEDKEVTEEKFREFLQSYFGEAPKKTRKKTAAADKGWKKTTGPLLFQETVKELVSNALKNKVAADIAHPDIRKAVEDGLDEFEYTNGKGQTKSCKVTMGRMMEMGYRWNQLSEAKKKGWTDKAKVENERRKTSAESDSEAGGAAGSAADAESDSESGGAAGSSSSKTKAAAAAAATVKNAVKYDSDDDDDDDDDTPSIPKKVYDKIVKMTDMDKILAEAAKHGIKLNTTPKTTVASVKKALKKFVQE